MRILLGKIIRCLKRIYYIIHFYDNRKQVAASRTEAEKDNVVVPTTIEEYCIKHRSKPVVEDVDILTDFYDDDYDDGDDYDCPDDYNDDNEDSGNGES